MKQPLIRLGPLALLLTVISICLTILAILTFTTARADIRLAERYAETVQARYSLEREGQEYLSRLNSGREAAPAPEGDGLLRADLESGGYLLHIILQDDGEGGYEPVSWREEKIWEPNETIDNLWSGSFGTEG